MIWTPAAAHHVSFFSCAKTASGSPASFTSTGFRTGVGDGVGSGVGAGVAAGVAGAGRPDAVAVAAGAVAILVGVALAVGTGVSGGSVTLTVGGVERLGTGPARNRSTLAMARSYRCPAPSVSLAIAPAVSSPPTAKTTTSAS